MVCKRCGGAIEASTGRCAACGFSESNSMIVHSLGELAERYGISVKEEEDKGQLPELFSEYTNQTRLSAAIGGETVEEKQTADGKPQLDMSEYIRLLGVDEAEEITAPQEENNTAQTQDQKKRHRAEAERAEEHPLLEKIDKIIEKPANKLLELYYKKHPRPARARGSAAMERLLAMLAVFGVLLAAVVSTVVIINSVAPDISGEWLVAETAMGERLTVEFASSGEVTAWAYIDGKANVYQKGTYKLRRSNGYNLLTITYEDGSERRMYYTLDGDLAEFTNVDSNKSDTYTRVK